MGTLPEEIKNKIHRTISSILVQLVEEWKRAVDAKEEVAVLSTDMSKAFDSLYPPLMLSKLSAYGFTGHALKLLRSYFTDRKN